MYLTEQREQETVCMSCGHIIKGVPPHDIEGAITVTEDGTVKVLPTRLFQCSECAARTKVFIQGGIDAARERVRRDTEHLELYKS